MGAPKKFKTGRAFRKAVESYFATITREKNVTERVPTGSLLLGRVSETKIWALGVLTLPGR